jgi:hypothetical protein
VFFHCYRSPFLTLSLAQQERIARSLSLGENPDEPLPDPGKSVQESSFGDVVSSRKEDHMASSSTPKTRGSKRKPTKPKMSKQSKRRRSKEDFSSDEPLSDASSDESSTSDSDEGDEDPQPEVETIIIGSKKVRKLPFQAVPAKKQVKPKGRRPRPRPFKPATNRETVVDVTMADDVTAATLPVDSETIVDISMVDAVTSDVRANTLQVDSSFDAIAIDSAAAANSAIAVTTTHQVDPPAATSATLLQEAPPPSPLDGIDTSTWPAWFKNGFMPLQEVKLGREWEGLLLKYINIEARAKFVSERGAMHAFSSAKRPAEVEWWIARARKPKPVIKDIAKFKDNFWSWWKGLQPKWREVGNVDGPLTSGHRCFEGPGDGDWVDLNKPGQNGFLTVVSLLCWWGHALCNGNHGMTEWRAAVDDVDWVLSKMLLVGGRK